MYTINFFGTGLAYWVCKMPTDEFDKLHQYSMDTGQDFENIFFDLDLIQSFGYPDWMNIHPIFSGMGMLLKDRNYIEIRNGNRRVRKIMSLELNENSSLFPLFSIQKDVYRFLPKDKSVVYVLLVQFVTGLIRKFTIDCSSLNLDDIRFYLNYQPLTHFLKEDWVTNIAYKNALMDQWQEDAVVQSSRVYVLQNE
jgi:hypothetical protein